MSADDLASDATMRAIAEPGKSKADPASGLDPTLPPTSGIEATLAASRPDLQTATAFEQPPLGGDIYEVRREIGRGGMGRVVEAHDRRLDRPVALKLLQVVSPDIAERFRREARITAQLQHPGIVPIYEAGRLGSEPFYAMKHVAGTPLDRRIADARTLTARLALLPQVLAVADALAFAHARRIVHRDLKPQNVIVGEFGETVVIDWGLAKDLKDTAAEPRDTAGPFRDAADGELTMAGAVMGTPAYMPPEQARGETVDERADVYAIGAMLYHALTGALVHDGKTAQELLGKAMAGAPHVPLVERAPDVPPDLAAIVEKALASDPARRYPTASPLAEDLRRFQTGQLVGVHRYTLGALLRRFLRKHRAAVAVAAAAIVVVSVLAVIGIGRIRRERAEAIHQRNAAIAQGDEATIAQAASLAASDPAAAIAWLKRLSPGSTRWAAARTIAADAAHHGIADLLPAPPFVVSTLRLDDAGRWLVAHSAMADQLVAYDLGAGTHRVIALPPDSLLGPLAHRAGWIAIATAAGIETVELSTGTRRALASTAEASAVDVTPDDAWLLARSGTGAHLVSLTGAASRAVAGATAALQLSRDGRQIVAVSEDRRHLRVLDLAGATLRELELPPSEQIELSADGSRAVVRAGRDDLQPLRVLDIAAGTWTELPDSHGLYNVELDGNAVYSHIGNELVWWDPATGAPSRRSATTPIPALGVTSVGAIRVWAIDEQLVVEGGPDFGNASIAWTQPGKVAAFVLARDGKTLFVAGCDSTLRRHRIEPPFERAICGEASLPFIAVSPGGQHYVQAGATPGTLQRCDVARGELETLTGGRQPIQHFVFSPDGATLVTSGGVTDKTQALDVVLWDLATKRPRPLAIDLRPRSVTNGGTQLVGVAGEDLAIVDVVTGTRTVKCRGFGNAKVSADGRIAFRVSRDGSERCSLVTGEVQKLAAFDAFDVQLAPDGTYAVATGKTGGMLWDLATGRHTALDLGTLEAARALSIARDGSRFAVVSSTFGSVFERDGRLVRRLRLPPGYLEQVELSEDGTRLLVADHDNGATIHDLATGQRRSLRGPPTTVRAWWLAGGQQLISVGGAGATRIWRWRDDLPSAPADLRAWIDRASGATVDSDGRLVGSLRPAR